MITANLYTHCGAWEFLLRLSHNDPAKATGRMDMDTASKVKSTGDVSTWHAMTTDAVIERLNTNTKEGLSASEVASRLQKYGANRLPEGTKRGPFMRFLSQFNSYPTIRCVRVLALVVSSLDEVIAPREVHIRQTTQTSKKIAAVRCATILRFDVRNTSQNRQLLAFDNICPQLIKRGIRRGIACRL